MSPPSMPVITAAAVAVGANKQIITPCATMGLNGAKARYTASDPKIWIANNQQCNGVKRKVLGESLLKVSNNMEKISTGVRKDKAPKRL